MRIYIDSDFKCHTEPGDGLREFDVAFFDGKSPEVVKGYCYIPKNENWKRADGKIFAGETISAWKPDIELDKAQLEYELAQVKAELAESGGSEALLEAADVAYKEGVNSAYD